MDCFKLNKALTMTGLQDLQDRVLMLSRALTMDRIAGLQDLQDKLCWAKLGVKYGQDGRITRFTG